MISKCKRTIRAEYQAIVSVRFDNSDPSSWKEQVTDELFGGRDFVEINVDLEDVSQTA